MSNKDQNSKALRALERISRLIADEPLPQVRGEGPATDRNGPLEPDKLKVNDVIGPKSLFIKIDADTGLKYVDDSNLHITDMDEDDVRKELQSRIDRLTQLKEKLDDLSLKVERRINAAGGVDVRVDTKKNLNLRRAISRVYGEKTDVITFSMYKKALELRKKLRKQEIRATTGRTMGEPPC